MDLYGLRLKQLTLHRKESAISKSLAPKGLVIFNSSVEGRLWINKAGLFNFPLGDQQKLLTFYEKRKYFDPLQRDVQSKTSL